MVQELEFREKTGKSFENFYEEYEDKLLWYLVKMCKDESAAQDIADDAFIKALTDIKKYDPTKSNISTWTFTIAKHLMFQYIKKRKKIESLDEDHDGASIVDFLISDNGDAEREEHILEMKLNIQKQGIYDLPKKYTEILLMRVIDGLSYKEISEYTGVALNTVKSRIRGGKLLLKKNLTKKINEINDL